MIWKIIAIIAVIVLFLQRSNILATIAQIKYNKGKVDSSLKIYALAEKIGKPNFEFRLAHAYISLIHGDIEKSNQLFNKMKLMPLNSTQERQLNANHALTYWKNNDSTTAIELLEKVLAEEESVTTYGSLGCIYAYGDNLAKSLEFNLKAYEYNPDDTVILDNLAYTYLKQLDFINAEIYYEKLFKLNPNFPECYYNYGLYKLQNGYTDEGLSYMKKALDKKFTFLSTVTRRDVLDALEKYDKNEEN